ncbi:tetratricopeptide repeat protein 39B-like [Atheta coriaria]|uniref:tetratricopeptide repeat protein 39B-like n=1 Tax=Dalotia coriaria TaxID=877792 RepID=UPI0031F362F7
MAEVHKVLSSAAIGVKSESKIPATATPAATKDNSTKKTPTTVVNPVKESKTTAVTTSTTLTTSTVKKPTERKPSISPIPPFPVKSSKTTDKLKDKDSSTETTNTKVVTSTPATQKTTLAPLITTQSLTISKNSSACSSLATTPTTPGKTLHSNRNSASNLTALKSTGVSTATIAKSTASSSSSTSSVHKLYNNTMPTTPTMLNNVEPDMDNDDDDYDDFQDAIEMPADMTLEKAVEEAQHAINLFFNNKIDDAKDLMTPWANVSMYHALGNAVFTFLEAMLTFEHRQLVNAGNALKHSIAVCNRYRRKNTIGESLGKMVKNPNFEKYTEMEAHAELCHAECLLLKAMLTFLEDETLSSFIKAGIKIRSCYNSYKDCQQILKKQKWGNSPTVGHFESGVKMGIGTFNLMISMLPSRVIKLLEFIGFSGNKNVGMNDLLSGYSMDGLRQILCCMTLLGYHLIVLYVLSHQEGDLKLAEEILAVQLKKYPKGAWFLFFKARLEFMKGNLNVSQEWYVKSWKSQDIWPQFHHFCFWELLWVNSVKTDWKEALVYSNYLLEGSRWSRTMYSYQKAALMIMQDEELSNTDRVVVHNLMKDVPKYKQRIAGKSLPMEKFAIRKAERFFNQSETLILPVIELMFLWNLFKLLRKSFNMAEKVLKLIEKALRNLTYSVPLNKYDNDNRAMLLLLKGACLRQMASPLQALECLETAISLQKEIIEDNYIVPYAIVELALLEWDAGNREKAILSLEDAKRNYSGYSLESRLHFRIHTALTEFKREQKQ